MAATEMKGKIPGKVLPQNHGERAAKKEWTRTTKNTPTSSSSSLHVESDMEGDPSQAQAQTHRQGQSRG